jgi:glycosyltransferase involved in cell wall biosynthesis
MIVKDESSVICRCLESVKHLLDYWVIVDTGSTDGTQEIIREFLSDVPGELHERPWVNFGHNRNAALDLARGKADYLFFIDADDRLSFSESFTMPLLDKDCYYVNQTTQCDESQLNNLVVLMIRDQPDYRWVGALHEVLSCKMPKSCETFVGVINEYHHDGARSNDPDIYLKEVQILEAAIREDTTNSRNIFYLARSYWYSGMLQQALNTYETRATMEGKEDEVYYSLYAIALLQSLLNESFASIVKSYCRAYSYRPTRAEPLFDLGEIFRIREQPFMLSLITGLRETIPFPSDDLFVEPGKY